MTELKWHRTMDLLSWYILFNLHGDDIIIEGELGEREGWSSIPLEDPYGLMKK